MSSAGDGGCVKGEGAAGGAGLSDEDSEMLDDVGRWWRWG